MKRLLLLVLPAVLFGQAYNAENRSSIFTVTNVSPVAGAASNTSVQNMMAVTLPAGVMNGAARLLHGWTQFLFTAGSGTSNGTDTFVAKLCSVSGCGSGTVITLVTCVTTANVISTTNGHQEFEFWASTVATGLVGTLEAHGRCGLVNVTGAITPIIYSTDNTTAVSSTFDMTAAWFLQITDQKSVNGATTSSNISTERLLVVESR